MKRKRREEEQEGRQSEPRNRKDGRPSQALLRQDRCLLGKSPGRTYISQNAVPWSPLGLLGKSPALSIQLNDTFCHSTDPFVVSLAAITPTQPELLLWNHQCTAAKSTAPVPPLSSLDLSGAVSPVGHSPSLETSIPSASMGLHSGFVFLSGFSLTISAVWPFLYTISRGVQGSALTECHHF